MGRGYYKEIQHSSIKKVRYEDAAKVRFDNEKIHIVYMEGRQIVKKVLPLYDISDNELFILIKSFRDSGINTNVKSKKKIFR